MSAKYLDGLRQIVGEKYVVSDLDQLRPFVSEYRGRYIGDALAVVKPENTDEVSKIVQYCGQHKIFIVPQGGNTSLVGGAISYDKKSIIMSLSRLKQVREIDRDNFSMTVEAGVVLGDIQQIAEQHGSFFPLSIGSEGSCQIGGCVASNAGGRLTIGYGNTRDLVLGIEAVLPNGEIWHGLKKLRKDNTGYDLKHLFIGSEGTLGVITAVTLKLFAKPKCLETFMVGIKSPQDALALLGKTREMAAEGLIAFELMSRQGIDFALEVVEGAKDPFDNPYPWYVLGELKGVGSQEILRQVIEDLLSQEIDNGLVQDAVLAQSEEQRKSLWFIREAIVEAQRYKGGSIKHDVSVPVSSIPEFLDQAIKAVNEYMSGVRPVPFGHMGDGNIHFNVTQPNGMDKKEYLAHWDAMNDLVHKIVHDLGGSISAEHGIGTFKVHELPQFKQPLELRLMRQVKNTLDPDNIMNPGKIFE